MAKEENVRLNAQYFYCCNDWTNSGVLKPWKPAELFKRLEENLPVRLILKRNIHAILQFIEYQEKKVFVLYTAGFNTLGRLLIPTLILIHLFRRRRASYCVRKKAN